MASVSGTSSIDTELIVQTYISQWRAKYITPISTKKTEQQAKNSALNTLKSYASALNVKNNGLMIGTSFLAKDASSSNESVLTAAVDATAVTGSYGVTVTQIAQQHKTASSQFTSANTNIVTAEGAGAKTIQLTVNGVSTNVNVTVNAGDTDQTILDATATAINASGAKVTATVIHETGTTSRLVLTSKETGLANTITVQDTAGTLALNSQIIDGGGALVNELQQALDAQFSIDTLNFTRSSNTVSDVLTGVTLQLKTNGASTLTVSTDVETIQNSLQEFVTAYNTLMGYAKEQTAYDVDTKERGTLYDINIARNLYWQLRPMATNIVTGVTSDYNSLAMIGIEVDREGTMSIKDPDKLTNALSGHFTDVMSLFSNLTDGVAVRMDDYLDELTAIDGIIAASENSIKTTVSWLDRSIAQKEFALLSYEAMMRQKFSALESLLSTNQSILSSLSGAKLLSTT